MTSDERLRVTQAGTNQRRRRYSPKLVEYVRRLGEHGYRIVEAEAAVRKLGIDPMPSRSTIKRWLDPDYWEAFRMASRKNRLPGPQPKLKWTWQRKLERLLQLSALPLSNASVARVMNHDYGLHLSTGHVRRMTADPPTISEASIKQLLSGGALKRGPKPR